MNSSLTTIIIPSRNEANFISKTLDSIISQDFPGDNLEIIISDGMSDDGTREIIQDYQDKYSNIKIIDNPERIVPSGFNRALNLAGGQIIIRIDGHAEIDRNYVANCVTAMKEKNADCVGGATKHSAKRMVGKIVNMAQSSKFGVGGVAFREGVKIGEYVDTLAFGAYKREIFEKIGGYDEELIRNQDDEFNLRLTQSGGKIWLDPTIKSIYYPRNSLKKLFIQYFQYGFYKVRVMQKRRGFASWRHLVPGAFVLSLFGSVLLLPVYHFPFYVIFGSYVIANFTATLYELLKSKKAQMYSLISSFALLPITFFTLHFSYGLGFLCGLGFFWNKWNDREVKDYHFDREQFIKNTKILPDS